MTTASLDATGRCFVSIPGRPGRTVTIRELDEPPVRMWLFGRITILETFLSRTVRETWPDQDRARLLSASRRARAGELLAGRRRRGRPGDLLDGIRLAGEAGLPTKRPELLAGTRLSSRRHADDPFQRGQALRAGLAHARSSGVSADRSLAVRLASSIDRLSAFV